MTSPTMPEGVGGLTETVLEPDAHVVVATALVGVAEARSERQGRTHIQAALNALGINTSEATGYASSICGKREYDGGIGKKEAALLTKYFKTEVLLGFACDITVGCLASAALRPEQAAYILTAVVGASTILLDNDTDTAWSILREALAELRDSNVRRDALSRAGEWGTSFKVGVDFVDQVAAKLGIVFDPPEKVLAGYRLPFQS